MSQIFPFSQATSIAFRCMVALVNAKKNLNIDELSIITSSSRHHVAKVLIRLVRRGIISSRRGPHGGFYLNSKPSEVTLLDILEATEGKLLFNNAVAESKWPPQQKTHELLSVEISLHIVTFLKNKRLSHYKKTRKREVFDSLIEV